MADKQTIGQESREGSYLFVWRVEDLQQDDGFFDKPSPALSGHQILCPFCSGRTIADRQLLSSSLPWRKSLKCLLCGWFACSSYRDAHQAQVPLVGTGVTTGNWVQSDAEHLRFILHEFEMSSEEVALAELGTYIRQHPREFNNLSWRRFEELVADVFRNYGYKVILTNPSRDNGADLILLEYDSARPYAIVECKRYRSDRKIQVDLVRKLVGAVIDWDVQKAYLVSSTDFSKGAKEAAARYRSKGFEIDLVALSDILTLLQVYNANLPKLHILNAQDRAAIMEINYSSIL